LTQKSGRSDFCVICVNFGLSTEERGPKRTIVLPVSSEASRPSVRPSKRPRRTRAIVGTVAALTATTGLYAFAVEPRWVATKPPPPGSGLGRGHWAMVAILGVLYVHGPGDESRYSLVQPAAVDHGSFERALAYVRENAAAWAESIDK